MEIHDIEVMEEEKLVKASLEGKMISEQANRAYLKFVTEHVEKGITRILINLKDLSFINSSGIGAIMMSLKDINNVGGRIAVCHCQPQVLEVFELTRLQKKLGLFKTEEEGLEYLKK